MNLDYYKNKLEQLQKLSKTGFWELDLQNNEIIYSSEIYNILEIDKSTFEHTYENFLDIVHPLDKELVNSFYFNSLKHSNKESTLIYKIITKSGKLKYLEQKLETKFDENNEPKTSFGTIQDISEKEFYRQKLEEDYIQIKEQQDELKAIFDNTKDGLAIIDLNTNFLRVNKTYCQITGLTQEELLNTNCIELTIPSSRDNLIKNFEDFLNTNEAKPFEVVCLIKNRKIEVVLYPYRINENHIMVNMKDIARDKMLEEQSKLISMGEMIGNIAHQWRQPLSVITSIASSINLLSSLNKLDNESLNNNMEKIIKQSIYLSDTIDDFRNFIVNTTDLENISIVNSVNKTLLLVDSALKMNKIKVISDFEDDLIIAGFQNELIQSFINLINNAKDAVIQNVKDVKDRVIIISTKKEKNGLKLEFKDNGGGIEEDILSRIFEPYFTTKHQSFGTGIGLAMTHKFITQRHKSSIEVKNVNFDYENKAYKGASFSIIFKNNLKLEENKES